MSCRIPDIKKKINLNDIVLNLIQFFVKMMSVFKKKINWLKY